MAQRRATKVFLETPILGGRGYGCSPFTARRRVMRKQSKYSKYSVQF